MDDDLTPAQLQALEDVRAYVLSKDYPWPMYTGEEVLNAYTELGPDPTIARVHGNALEIFYDALKWAAENGENNG